ncbi:MAG: hypothetical protein IPG67_16045 [Acidobacteria bacterium]|nr:hypothetical protein [Acidobacteriota bacterium]MBK7935503.1 hypothetical protein [Acidobacteriota bacterium]
MGYKLTVENGPEYLKLTAVGDHSAEEMYAFIDNIKAEAVRNDSKRVLVDSFEYSTLMSEADKFALGSHLAKTFGPRLKVAIMLPAEHISKLGELAAVNRGANLLVTPSESDAIAWLTA